MGEKFRPECLLRGTGKYPVCAIECKKLNDKFAKARWKEGLSQSLLYSQYYKAVIYVLFDYSTGARYQAATTNDDLGRGTAQLTMMTTIGSTVDLIEMGGNLYGLTGHRHRGAHTMGDLIVCNFNDGATKSIPLIQLAQSIRRNPIP